MGRILFGKSKKEGGGALADKQAQQQKRIKRQVEIEHPDIQEIEEQTPHPDTAAAESQAEQLRYQNADHIYG